MGLGRIAGEAIGDVIFLKMLSGAWGWAKGLVTDEVKEKAGKELKEKIINPKGWNDEHFFALDLAEAVAPADRKKLVEGAMRRAVDFDIVNGTTYARNFRMIVACNDKDNPSTNGTPAVPGTLAKPAIPPTPEIPATATTPAVPAKPGSPAVPAVPAKPAIPGTRRPGIIILEDLANSCTTVDEAYARIIAVGMIQDGHSNMEKFTSFVSKKAWPFIVDQGVGIYHSADAAVLSIEKELKSRRKEFKKRPWWKKMLFN